MAGPVKAYNASATGSVGPGRSRIKQIGVFCTGTGAFTITDGNGGATLLQQKFPVGHTLLNIPGDGIISENGVYVSAISGTAAELTIFLA
jgi:hypothetical protein